METQKLKPFVKWAGGKTQLLNYIRQSYPKELGKSINKYCEPFIGGGAVLFDVLSNYSLKEIYISDINYDLINTYKVLQQNIQQLINTLEKYEYEYHSYDINKRKEYYYCKRDRFNQLKFNYKLDLSVEKASLFIFLNKTCFNGLYRVNKKGLFNVPIGSYEKPSICDKDNLLNISKSLKKVKIHYGSYIESSKFIDRNTFVYIDPPYRPLTQTSRFTSYNEFEFTDKQQIELAEFASKLKIKGAKILLSNSDPKNISQNDNFFENLYQGFVINKVYANRMINCKGTLRGKIKELLILNY